MSAMQVVFNFLHKRCKNSLRVGTARYFILVLPLLVPELALAIDSPVCNAGTSLCDQGMAYQNALREADEYVCNSQFLPTVNTHNSSAIWRDYTTRYRSVAECYRAWDNLVYQTTWYDSYYPANKTCSARPPLNLGPAGNYCHEGCAYTSSGQQASPTGEVCNANEPDIDPGKNNCCNGSSEHIVGNPVNSLTGVKLEVAVDYLAPAGGLELKRYYSSADGLFPAEEIGMAWRHSYMRSVDETSPTTAVLRRPSGNFYLFKKNTSGNWTPDWDVPHRLSEVIQSSVRVGWKVTLADNSTEHFDNDGVLTRIEWANGDGVSLSYTGGDLSEVADRHGRKILLSWSSNRIASLDLPDGTVVQYTYDGVGRLVSVNMEDILSTSHILARYEYGDVNFPSALTRKYDGSNAVYASWSYDTTGRVSRSVLGDPIGAINEDIFSYSSGITTVTHSSGSVVDITSNTKHGRAKASSFSGKCISCNGQGFSSRTYDGNGYPDVEIDLSGVSTNWDYSPDGLLYRKVESENGSSETKRTTITYWNTSTRLPTSQELRDGLGVLKKRMAWSYNGRGQILSETITDPSIGLSRITYKTYCEATDVSNGLCPLVGLMKSYNGPRTDVSDVTNFAYYMSDESSCSSSPVTCLYRKGDLWKSTNALGHVTEYLKYDGAGRVLSVKDSNGVVTDYEYHPRGWLTHLKTRGGDNLTELDDAITEVSYWPTGLVKRITLPDGGYTEYNYDQAHRLTSVSDSAGNSIVYVLDNAGNILAEEIEDGSNVVKHNVYRAFDSLRRMITHADSQYNPTDYTYGQNGEVSSITDPLNQLTSIGYDPLKRLISWITDDGGLSAETNLKYDSLDNVTQVTDPNGLDTAYSYNGLSDLLRITSPDTGLTVFTYDSGGNTKSKTDARGVAVNYTYDVLNRLVGVTYPTTSSNVSYIYDVTQSACGSGETFSVGKMTRMQDASGSTQYCYDRFGYLVRKLQTINGVSFSTRYAYTKMGALSAITYPDETIVDYVRNGLGQVEEIGITRIGSVREILLDQLGYYPFGPTSGWVYGNNRSLIRNHDLDYRAASVEESGVGGLSLGFSYDAAGQLVGLGEASSTTPEISYAYDGLGQLLRTEDAPTQVAIDTYTYDLTGNRTSHITSTGTTAYTYEVGSHRLESVGVATRTYDAAGNTTSIGGTALEFAYDDAGRLAQAKSMGIPTMNYAYTGRGERVRRYIGSSNVYSLYDESGRWIGEYDDTGSPIQQIIWMDDLPVGLLANGNQTHYIEPDHVGSPRVVVEAARNVPVWTWNLKGEAFGATSPDQNPDGDANIFVFDMRFPGQRFDTATGLNYNYFRDYEPGSGRYVQSDPIGLYGGISTYAYVESNPLTYVDHLGLAVYLCSRPVNVDWVPMSMRPYLRHMWVKTSTTEAGMGGECPVPGQGCADVPYSATKTKSHAGQSELPGATCILQQNVDEACVNSKINPGQPTGKWSVLNQCQSFSNAAIAQCRYGPQDGPLLPNTLRGRGPLGSSFSPNP